MSNKIGKYSAKLMQGDRVVLEWTSSVLSLYAFISVAARRASTEFIEFIESCLSNEGAPALRADGYTYYAEEWLLTVKHGDPDVKAVVW